MGKKRSRPARRRPASSASIRQAFLTLLGAVVLLVALAAAFDAARSGNPTGLIVLGALLAGLLAFGAYRLLRRLARPA